MSWRYSCYNGYNGYNENCYNDDDSVYYSLINKCSSTDD